jgi:arginyl-tRNA synthetase
VVKEQIQAIVESVLRELQIDPGGSVQMDVPRDTRHGDYSTNVALVLGKRSGRAPADLARALVERLAARTDLAADVSIAGPGFINFKLREAGLTGSLAALLQQGVAVFPPQPQRGRMQIEFVSANPTGPLNVVSARAAAYGSTLARMLRIAGWDTDTEFYVNDAGRQVELLGASVQARFAERHGVALPFPEDGYKGDYVHDLAARVAEAEGRAWMAQPDGAQRFGSFAVEQVLAWQRADLEAFGVRFDRWFRESELHVADRVRDTLEVLEARGHVYQDAGATFFRTTAWGDEKDRVVVRSDGNPTYFLADAAYHRDKRERGYDHVIDVWGPDHHGHIPRMQAVAGALGYGADWLEIVIIQWVKLVESGKSVKMSKRAGQIVTLGNLLSEVDADVAKYFFLMRHQSSHLDFDLDLATETSDENPVYYVKYAHARICSIIAKAAAAGLAFAPAPGAAQHAEAAPLDRLTSPEEHALIKLLVDFPAFVVRAADAREPHRLTTYAEDVARAFHRFYHERRVLQDDEPLAWARLALCEATRRVLAAGLGTMGIDAPQSMARDEDAS